MVYRAKTVTNVHHICLGTVLRDFSWFWVGN